ncbi:type III polyketide synthase [Sphingomonas sp. BIUV-7]|uniref:Type III polyketide synthase n=1 Tax=Sphingomonas natans TaxID=3063330 RepID=A0ABT8YCB8_9SPHN|nr:type III polyketide synthase [Sphingomonas sp. BIUV-7]MDO6415982.1 type III polyketide synthase [Sphingomonas sp. BIUV-7]
MVAIAHINRVGTATPPNEVHSTFVDWAKSRITDPRTAKLFARMADRAGIENRWSVLEPDAAARQIDPGGFYHGDSPTTARRMTIYAEEAPKLALAAIARLGAIDGITHLVVASCTGFVAPGIDQIIATRLGLSASVERTLVGFMGCYAAVAALRTAHHIVRSEPAAKVLVVTVELCTLHLQHSTEIEPLLAMLQFGDGAAAAIVSADPVGLAITRTFSAALPDSAHMIRWDIGDTGFVMHLAGAVPARIADALSIPAVRAATVGDDAVDLWAVHAGGRSVLDAVERALSLADDALDASRAVLAEKGNMSSATLLFVLERLLREERPAANGIALAFGPGMAAEGFGFRSVA